MIRILVIDDETSVLSNVRLLFELEGYEVLIAEDGLRGLIVAREHVPDLIVCDIVMPVLDGFAVLRELRSNPDTAHIPLLFITGVYSRAELSSVLDQGQTECVFKPFTTNELLTAVRKYTSHPTNVR